MARKNPLPQKSNLVKPSHWLLLLLLAAASGTAALKWKEAEALRAQNDELRKTCKSLEDFISGFTSNQNAAKSAELEQLRKNTDELLRLRSEATKLRAKAAEAEKLRAENQKLRAAASAAALNPSAEAAQSTNAAPDGKKFPRDSWKFSGYATPEATLLSAIAAMRDGNPRAYLDSLSPEEQARQTKAWGNQSEADIAAQHQQTVANITGFEILSSQNISDDEVQMSVFVDGPGKTEQVSMVRNGSDWKFAGFVPAPAK